MATCDFKGIFDMKYDDLSAEDLWNICLFNLAKEFDPKMFKIWIEPLQASLDGTFFTLYATSRVKIDFIKKEFTSKIEKILIELAGDDISLKFAVSTTAPTADTSVAVIKRNNQITKEISLQKNNTQSIQAKPTLLPVRHPQRDFFTADILDYALKDDGVSMEAPIFTLSTKPDLSTWKWQSKDGNRFVEVYPSVKGRATQFDKDILIYVISQMTAGINQKREDANNRTIRFTVYDYLVVTNKAIGGKAYVDLIKSLERLAGTRITTDIKTGDTRIREGFGIIDKYKIVEKDKKTERMIALEVTLSEWLYNAIHAHEVLTLHKDYFRLRSPLERRIYELARKHCGNQKTWSISLDLLKAKSGSKSQPKLFKHYLKEIIARNTIPEYNIELDSNNLVTFRKKSLPNFGISET